MGYYRAGFAVYGIDNKPQPHYPFPFLLMDALEAMDRLLRGEGLTFSNGETLYMRDFDAYHASPPCQKFSVLNNLFHSIERRSEGYIDLITPARRRLFQIDKPYVIENVVGAPLISPVTLCGTMFGLRVLRHRQFETNWFLWQPFHIKHNGTVNEGHYMTVAGMGGGMYLKTKGGERRKGSRKTEDWKIAMDIDWMTRYELTQAIPPAYTEYIGKYLIEAVRNGNRNTGSQG